MKGMDYTRQEGIFDPKKFKDVPICVIGAGSVGSFVVLTLAKLGFENITVWDDDRVEAHNIPNQFYPMDLIGMHKVYALEKVVKQFAGVEIHPYCFRWEPKKTVANIIVSAVDSLDVRRDIWEAVKGKGTLYVDARMGGELMRVFVVRGQQDYSFYEDSLKGEAVPLPCTARSIIYNVLAVASVVAMTVKKFVGGEQLYREVVFDMKNMIFQVGRK